MLLYYITDRRQFPGGKQECRERLLDKIAEAARNGIDYVQLREKDLSGCNLERLAREAKERIRASSTGTRLLINSRTDVALAVGADGVHLRSHDISPPDVRKVWRRATGVNDLVIAVSCHTEAEVISARQSGADFVVFGPVFGKSVPTEMNATGLKGLHSVCAHTIPVVALGGVTLANARLCFHAGAAGIAGIRLFQENEIEKTVLRLREP